MDIQDTTAIRKKLASDVGQVPWSYLAPHAAAGNLLFVDPTIPLEDAGAALSANQTEPIQHWLKSGDLLKIEAIHTAQWENGATEFEALVVLPFVLCRPV
jgi:hypothetical protein